MKKLALFAVLAISVSGLYMMKLQTNAFNQGMQNSGIVSTARAQSAVLGASTNTPSHNVHTSVLSTNLILPCLSVQSVSYSGSCNQSTTGNQPKSPIKNPAASTTPLQFTNSTTLPNATIGQPYSTPIGVTGGVAPYNVGFISTTYPVACCQLGGNIGTDGIGVFNTQTSSTVVGPAGTYTWTYQATDAAGSTITEVFTLTVIPATPNPQSTLIISPSSLNFVTTQGTNPPNQPLTTSGLNGQWIANIVNPSGTWLQLVFANANPSTGATGIIGSTNIVLGVNSSGLAAGTYNASIVFSSYNAYNSPTFTPLFPPVTVPVTLTVNAPSVCPQSTHISTSVSSAQLKASTISICEPLIPTAPSTAPALAVTEFPGFFQGNVTFPNGSAGQTHVTLASFELIAPSNSAGGTFSIPTVAITTPNTFVNFKNLEMTWRSQQTGIIITNPQPSTTYVFTPNTPILVSYGVEELLEMHADVPSNITTNTQLSGVTLSGMQASINNQPAQISGIPVAGQPMYFTPATTTPTPIVSKPVVPNPTPLPITTPIAETTGVSNSSNTASLSTSFPDGTIIKGSNQTVYLVFGNQKYGIPSVNVFNRLGLSFKNVQQVGDNTISSLPTASIEQ